MIVSPLHASADGDCEGEVQLNGRIEAFWKTGFDAWSGEGLLICDGTTVGHLSVVYDDIAGGFGATGSSVFKLKISGIDRSQVALLSGRFQSNGGQLTNLGRHLILNLCFPSPRDGWIAKVTWDSIVTWGVRAFERAGYFTFDLRPLETNRK